MLFLPPSNPCLHIMCTHAHRALQVRFQAVLQQVGWFCRTAHLGARARLGQVSCWIGHAAAWATARRGGGGEVTASPAAALRPWLCMVCEAWRAQRLPLPPGSALPACLRGWPGKVSLPQGYLSPPPVLPVLPPTDSPLSTSQPASRPRPQRARPVPPTVTVWCLPQAAGKAAARGRRGRHARH